jgi:protein-L-isoaspartate O-methyltransferase
VAQKAARCLAWGDPTGYHAAVLSLVFEQVYLIEPDAAHAARAAERLKKLGYANVQVRQGDFAKGWSEHAPYDAVVLSAPVYAPPEAMQAQLGVGGRMAFSVAGAPPDDMTVVQKLTDGAIGPITEATPDTAAPDAARGARPSAPE